LGETPYECAKRNAGTNVPNSGNGVSDVLSGHDVLHPTLDLGNMGFGMPHLTSTEAYRTRLLLVVVVFAAVAGVTFG
jgi:hypothetical protein